MSNKLFVNSPILLCRLLNKVLGDKYYVAFAPYSRELRIYRKVDDVTIELEEVFQLYLDMDKRMWVVVVED